MVAEHYRSSGGPYTCKRKIVPERRGTCRVHPGERRAGIVRKRTAEDPRERYFIQIQSNKNYERYETEVDAWLRHFPDLGLTRSSNSPRFRIKKNPPWNPYKDEDIILYTSQTYNNTLEEDKYDMKKKFLLDTGCVRTVCGRRWLAHCMKTMNPEVRKDVKSRPSKHVFRFGRDERLASLGTVSIPLSIEGKNFHLETEIITSDIPCLLSKGAMKKARLSLTPIKT